MSTLHLASSESESSAVTRLTNQQTERVGALAVRVAALSKAVENSDGPLATTARAELVIWAHTDLLPHLSARETTLYPAARRTERARMLVETQLAAAGRILQLVAGVEEAPNPVQALARASAIEALFTALAAADQEHILPLLAQEPGVALAELAPELQQQEAQGKEAAAASDAAAAEAAEGGHSCGCGGKDESGLPELDARSVPHAIRHATIFGALDGVGPGSGMVLLAPHDPLPLLAQISERWPDVFTVTYLERGPETWKLSFTR